MNLWWWLRFLDIRVPFAGQIVAARIAIIAWHWHFQQIHLVLCIARTQSDRNVSRQWHFAGDNGGHRIASTGHCTAASITNRRWRWPPNEYMLTQLTACVGCYGWCIHSLRTAIVMKCAAVAFVTLWKAIGKCSAHFVRWILWWPLSLAQRQRLAVAATMSGHRIFIVAGNATAIHWLLPTESADKFYNTSLVTAGLIDRIIVAGGRIISVHCAVLLLLCAHFIKISEYSYDWQLYCTYRHSPQLGRSRALNSHTHTQIRKIFELDNKIYCPLSGDPFCVSEIGQQKNDILCVCVYLVLHRIRTKS